MAVFFLYPVYVVCTKMYLPIAIPSTLQLLKRISGDFWWYLKLLLTSLRLCRGKNFC